MKIGMIIKNIEDMKFNGRIFEIYIHIEWMNHEWIFKIRRPYFGHPKMDYGRSIYLFFFLDETIFHLVKLLVDKS